MRIVLDGLAEQIDGGVGIVLLEIHRASERAKIILWSRSNLR
jgi:hypothetical protein